MKINSINTYFDLNPYETKKSERNYIILLYIRNLSTIEWIYLNKLG